MVVLLTSVGLQLLLLLASTAVPAQVKTRQYHQHNHRSSGYVTKINKTRHLACDQKDQALGLLHHCDNQDLSRMTMSQEETAERCNPRKGSAKRANGDRGTYSGKLFNLLAVLHHFALQLHHGLHTASAGCQLFLQHGARFFQDLRLLSQLLVTNNTACYLRPKYIAHRLNLSGPTTQHASYDPNTLYTN